MAPSHGACSWVAAIIAFTSTWPSVFQYGPPLAPHFLYHALIAALFAMHLAPSLLCAGRLILVACYLIIPFILYGFLRTVLRVPAFAPAYLFIAGLTILLAQPITLAHAYALGYFWPEPYQIPTSTLLKPFALAGSSVQFIVYPAGAGLICGSRRYSRL